MNFDTNSANLKAESHAILDRVAKSLNDWPQIRVEIAGHTDSVGSDTYNRTLSQRRADSVKKHLVEKGVAAERLTTKGYGEAEPIADNGNDAGRAKNRRVELRRLD
ncbi:MAG: OmpA family protein [Acidobacteria bacterium]|nr:OmpA family protein [Acidobacteriota bacterium]